MLRAIHEVPGALGGGEDSGDDAHRVGTENRSGMCCVGVLVYAGGGLIAIHAS